MLFGFVSPDRASTLLRLLGCSDSTGDSLSTPVQTEGWPRVGEDGRVKGLLQLETWNRRTTENVAKKRPGNYASADWELAQAWRQWAAIGILTRWTWPVQPTPSSHHPSRMQRSKMKPSGWLSSSHPVPPLIVWTSFLAGSFRKLLYLNQHKI